MDDSQKSPHSRATPPNCLFLTSTEPSIDSREDLANSINAMLIHFGKKELPHEVIASYIGDGAPMLVRRSLGDPDDENFVQDAVLYFMAGIASTSSITLMFMTA